ncbi:conjugal transfer protein TrbH [Massilia glaciei]|uniref:Conjugal transfer protein TrbH n=1 Tax=Massilia glaciei TaxID=1524097 RepID=A0A2U2I6J1_9BURK|nr:conjugal transfer protein TrbH [Massilia glaciei]PWF55364.1 conjugal transfer protein TrbH [Massilia glaciei]
MQKTFLLVLLMVGLAGCASSKAPRVPFGSFVQTPVAADDKAIADDVVKKLAALYPPAKTRFNLQHATPDAFGTSVVAALRAKGYALAEVKQGARAAAPAAGEQALAYVIDQPLDAGLYRVTLLVNSQTLSRVYQSSGGAVAPAGAWVRKE